MTSDNENLVVLVPKIVISRITLPIKRATAVIALKIVSALMLILSSGYFSLWGVADEIKVNEYSIENLFPFEHNLFISFINYAIGIALYLFLFKLLRLKFSFSIKKYKNSGVLLVVIGSISASIVITLSFGPSIFLNITKTENNQYANNSTPIAPATKPGTAGTLPAPKSEQNAVDEALTGCSNVGGGNFRCPANGSDVNVEKIEILENGTKVGDAIIFSMGAGYVWDYNSANIRAISNNLPDINEAVKRTPFSGMILGADAIYYVGTASSNGGPESQIYLSSTRSTTIRNIVQTNLLQQRSIRGCNVNLGRYTISPNDHESQRPVILVAVYRNKEINTSVVNWDNTYLKNLFWKIADNVNTGQFSLNVRISGYYSYNSREDKVICD